MADTSNYSIEERWVASVVVHEGQHTGQRMNKLKTAYQQRFGKPSPPEASRLSYEKFVVSFRQVKDSPRRGRPMSRTVTCPLLLLALNNRRTNRTEKVNGFSSTVFEHVWQQEEWASYEVISVRVRKRIQPCWHGTTSRSMYFTFGTISNSLVSREMPSQTLVQFTAAP
jgi:hypothetical protein